MDGILDIPTIFCDFYKLSKLLSEVGGHATNESQEPAFATIFTSSPHHHSIPSSANMDRLLGFASRIAVPAAIVLAGAQR